MASSAEKINRYKNLLINLLPGGRLWKPAAQPVFDALLESTAQELCRVDDRFKDLLTEIDPKTTTEAIERWENILGLPDECSPEAATLDERRTLIVQRLTNIGGISKTFYEFVGDQFGFEIFVNDYLPFRVGQAVVGDELSNDFQETFTVGDTVGTQLTVEGWRTFFEVNMPVEAADIFEVGDNTVGDALREFSNPVIECTMRKLKPAHTGVFFTFRE